MLYVGLDKQPYGDIISKITQTVLVIITMILTGCGGKMHKSVNLGDGTTAYEINCFGAMRSYADCRNYAAEICNGKYKELDKEEYSQPIINYMTGQRINVRKRSMTVICQ